MAALAALQDWYALNAHIARVFLSINFFQKVIIGLLSANLLSKIMLGVTLAHYRIASREFGIRFLFGFVPRFYVERSRIAELPYSAQRRCFAAPLMTKMTLAALGILSWVVLRRSGSGAADLGLALGVVGLSSYLFTVNPLWPADGYRWLTAYLKRPNLRAQSFRLLTMLARGRSLPTRLGAGEAWALASFGILSVIFSLTLLFLIIQAIAFALEAQLRGTGVVLFGVLLVMFVTFLVKQRKQSKVRKDARRSQRVQKTTAEQDRNGHTIAEQVRNPQVYSNVLAAPILADTESAKMPKHKTPSTVTPGKRAEQSAMEDLISDAGNWAHPQGAREIEDDPDGFFSPSPVPADQDDVEILLSDEEEAELDQDPLMSELEMLLESEAGDDTEPVDQPDKTQVESELADLLAGDLDEIELEADPMAAELEALLAVVEESGTDLGDILTASQPPSARPEPEPEVAPEPKKEAKDAEPEKSERSDVSLGDLEGFSADLEDWSPEDDLIAGWEEDRDPHDPAPEAPEPRPRAQPIAPEIDEDDNSKPTARRRKRTGADTAPPRRGFDELDQILDLKTPEESLRNKWRVRLIWAAILAALLYVAFLPYAFEVGGEFTIQPVAQTQVRARTDGEIIKLNVDEGDWVERDQILAVLSNWDELRDIAVREAEIARLEADLQTLLDGARPEQIALAEEAVAAAKLRVSYTKLELDRKAQLFESGTVTRAALDSAESEHQYAVAALDEAQAQLDLTRSGARESEIAAARANIARNQEDLDFARLQLEQTNIRAIADGQIVSDMDNVPVGAFLPAGALFAVLENNRIVQAAIEVPETEIDEVEIGAEVTLKLWSASSVSVTGTVSRIAPVAEQRDFGKVVRVIVQVPNPEGKLASNMTGFGKISARERPVWEAFSRAILRFFQVELWSWLP